MIKKAKNLIGLDTKSAQFGHAFLALRPLPLTGGEPGSVCVDGEQRGGHEREPGVCCGDRFGIGGDGAGGVLGGHGALPGAVHVASDADLDPETGGGSFESRPSFLDGLVLGRVRNLSQLFGTEPIDLPIGLRFRHESHDASSPSDLQQATGIDRRSRTIGRAGDGRRDRDAARPPNPRLSGRCKAKPGAKTLTAPPPVETKAVVKPGLKGKAKGKQAKRCKAGCVRRDGRCVKRKSKRGVRR
jgi:hypothetical protein